MEQGLNRRRFLGTAIGTGVAAAGAGSFASPAFGDAAGNRASSGGVPRNRRGIQLYSLRRIMDNSQADARTVLRWLGRNGYTEVEPYPCGPRGRRFRRHRGIRERVPNAHTSSLRSGEASSATMRVRQRDRSVGLLGQVQSVRSCRDVRVVGVQMLDSSIRSSVASAALSVCSTHSAAGAAPRRTRVSSGL